MKTKILQALDRSPLFHGLPRGLLEKIAGSVTRKKLAAGEVLFQKGDHANALWGVLSGRVVVEVRTDDGKEMVLDSYEPGDIFGEVGVLDFGPRRFDAVAQTDAELFRLDRSQFLEYLQSNPEFCFRIFTLLCTHLRKTTGTLEDTALYKLSGRLAKRLLILAAEVTDGMGVALLNISQSELARLLGVNREAVNRQLREWERAGWIVLGREKVEVVNRQRLQELAAPIPQSTPNPWDPDVTCGVNTPAFTDPGNEGGEGNSKDRRSATVLAIDCGTYTSLLRVDSTKAIKRIKKDLAAIDRGIALNGGRVVWSVGERTIAEFSGTGNAIDAALQIHRSTRGARGSGKCYEDSFCRIGIHAGEVLTNKGRVFGEPVNVAIELTKVPSSGGICFTAELFDGINNAELLASHSLGKLELKGIGRALEVYSVKPLPRLARLKLRLEKIIPRRHRPVMAVGGLLLTMALMWFSGRISDEPSSGFTAIPGPTIAVLPFKFDSDTAHAWMVSGLEDSIRRDLASVPRVLVVGQQSSQYFRDRKYTAKDVGEILKVNFVLFGSAKILQDRLELTTRLVTTAAGEEVWRRVQRGSIGDFDRIRAANVLGVGRTLVGEDFSERVKTLPNIAAGNDEARSLYLMARHHLSHSHGGQHLQALNLLKSAVASGPEFAPAWVLLSSLYESDALDQFPEFDPEIRMVLHNEAWEKAVSLAPNSAAVLSGKASRALRNGKLEEASTLAQKAAAAYPNDPTVLSTLWGVFAAHENWAAAMSVSERMLILDPLNVYYMARHIAPIAAIEQCDEVLELAEKALVIYPGNASAHVWMASCLGDPVRATEASTRAWPYGAPLALWYGLDEIELDMTSIQPRHAANLHAYMANYDSARDALDQAFPHGQSNTFPQLKWEYLVARGELEVLAGEYVLAIGFFERALSLLPVGKGELAFQVTLRQWISGYRQSNSALALLHAYRESGLTRKADRIAATIRKELDARRQGLERVGAVDVRHVHRYAEIQFLAIEGRSQEAITMLEDWLDHDRNLFNYVRRDPFLKSLHNESRFWRVVAAVEARLADIRAQYRTLGGVGSDHPKSS